MSPAPAERRTGRGPPPCATPSLARVARCCGGTTGDICRPWPASQPASPPAQPWFRLAWRRRSRGTARMLSSVYTTLTRRGRRPNLLSMTTDASRGADGEENVLLPEGPAGFPSEPRRELLGADAGPTSVGFIADEDEYGEKKPRQPGATDGTKGQTERETQETMECDRKGQATGKMPQRQRQSPAGVPGIWRAAPTETAVCRRFCRQRSQLRGCSLLEVRERKRGEKEA